MSADTYLAVERRLVDAALKRYMPTAGAVPTTVRRAMAYSLFPGGKRLRPILAITACRALRGRASDVLPSAAAIEMIHTYSLIHDDLPALDDDDLRRGQATSHKVFGDALAILAGDALLTHAFETMATYPRGTRIVARKILALEILSRAAGVSGMIGGQVMDLESEGKSYTYRTLNRIHARKTGALISAAVQIGGIVGGAGPAQIQMLKRYGDGIGLAFQVIDDILDVTQTSAKLGKSAGKDVAAGKATYPAILGMAASRREA
ncbi:MAG: polyprenyl synthetase family protein, partial [Acidobacteria bacterium]|nr:polyprenyl synthetase family protein [Acidobacteriota bacterium]